jgi:hypothetical protein
MDGVCSIREGKGWEDVTMQWTEVREEKVQCRTFVITVLNFYTEQQGCRFRGPCCLHFQGEVD